jgi:hypothetical protein
MYNMRLVPTMAGSEITVRRIDATEEGATTLAGEQQEGRRPSRRTHDGSLSLNPAAQIFEPQTEDKRSNFQKHEPPNHDSSDVLNNSRARLGGANRSVTK